MCSQVIEKGNVQVFRISQVCHVFVEVVTRNLEDYREDWGIVLSPGQTGNVWRPNIIKHCLVIKHFTVGHLVCWCLMMFDRVWTPSNILSNDIKHFFCSHVCLVRLEFEQNSEGKVLGILPSHRTWNGTIGSLISRLRQLNACICLGNYGELSLVVRTSCPSIARPLDQSLNMPAHFSIVVLQVIDWGAWTYSETRFAH